MENILAFCHKSCSELKVPDNPTSGKASLRKKVKAVYEVTGLSKNITAPSPLHDHILETSLSFGFLRNPDITFQAKYEPP